MGVSEIETWRARGAGIALEPKFARRLAELLDLPGVDDAEKLAERIKSKTLAEWLDLFEDEDVAAGPVWTLEEAARDFGSEPSAGRAPALGEHTETWRAEL